MLYIRVLQESLVPWMSALTDNVYLGTIFPWGRAVERTKGSDEVKRGTEATG